MMTAHPAIHTKPDRLLKTTLLGNAAFTFLSGLVLVLAPGDVAALMGLSGTSVFIITGLLLIPYAFFLYRVAVQRPIPGRLAIVVILLDIAWVTGSIILLLSGLAPLAATGKWAIAIVADIVALFALLQFIGLRRAINGSNQLID